MAPGRPRIDERGRRRLLDAGGMFEGVRELVAGARDRS